MMKQHKKVLFCGLGSIGQKHLRNLIAAGNQRNISFTIHALRVGNRPLPEDIASHIDISFHETQTVDHDYDIIMVTNPTNQHYDTILQLQGYTKAMFIEKPVFDQIYDTDTIKKDVIFYVACPLRHTAILKHLKQTIDMTTIFHARAISSSYLPSWRPNSDYTKTYSANKEMGGGVALDLIHEWDYLVDLFGFPDHVSSIKRKISDLAITSDDIAVYIASQKQRVIELHLDYFGHIPRRQIELYSADNTYLVDIMASSITDKTNIITQIEKEDMYLNEMNYFLSLIDGHEANINDITHAQQILGIAIH